MNWIFSGAPSARKTDLVKSRNDRACPLAYEPSGEDFLSISPSPPVAARGAAPAEVKLELNVTGTYFEIIDYLDRLNDLARLVVVDTLGLTPGAGAAGSTDQMSVALSARMFTTQSPAVKSAAAGKGGAASKPAAGGASTTTSSSVPASNETVTTSTSSAPQITVSPNNG